ncbi:uncharacterized protein LOC111054243 [Nilaparvata lugens]|uniref:uncharacterized protein LOC111054243 n=1 Tax=Nilaparvata lugens TaxID=108931 RepID=UPI00193D9CAB|nr:uncharacterized protein LOC111054243 [Nilaparvata lugens]
MDSPPVCSAWSGLSSEDSGLLLTSDSLSSSNSNWQFTMELIESEDDRKSFSSHHDSLELFDHFDTVKKGKPVGIEPIDPPLEFQDEPESADDTDISECVRELAAQLVETIVEEAMSRSVMTSTSVTPPRRDTPQSRDTLYATPPTSMSRRPASRQSLSSSSRLSSSHNSLSVPAANKADDSSFITSAMSHDVLTAYDDSDIYTLPVDSLMRPYTPCPRRPKRHHRPNRKKRRHTVDNDLDGDLVSDLCGMQPALADTSKRHSVPGTSGKARTHRTPCEPIHMTLQEVRQFLSDLYAVPHDAIVPQTQPQPHATRGLRRKHRSKLKPRSESEDNCVNINNNNNKIINNNVSSVKSKKTSSPNKNSFSYTLKQTLCNLFRFRSRSVVAEPPTDAVLVLDVPRGGGVGGNRSAIPSSSFTKRALPPLPAGGDGEGEVVEVVAEGERGEGEGGNGAAEEEETEEANMDFASSIEKVKDYGWYWGPISGETAEKILSNEPDGSFIVRDSSDDHYIFSLTFKLNGVVRHVRIEHDQGNFSFGSCTKFKSRTIVEFIENAVEHSRGDRYLFFLHRRPIHGPMRVQLLHPVSRFKQVQSLQHMCRFVILKVVRRDLIGELPLPRRILDYLSSPHYYSEHPSLDDRSSPLHLFPFMPPPAS